jgi:hypothetical protein
MITAVVPRTLGFVIVRGLLGLVGLGPAPDAKDVEIAVLRHQLAVLGPCWVRAGASGQPAPVHPDRPDTAGAGTVGHLPFRPSRHECGSRQGKFLDPIVESHCAADQPGQASGLPCTPAKWARRGSGVKSGPEGARAATRSAPHPGGAGPQAARHNGIRRLAAGPWAVSDQHTPRMFGSTDPHSWTCAEPRASR